jgi:glycosyltransferase involved in cell wall biosynthesis
MTAVLTIYIPTFNRPKQLLRTLEGLLPQLNDKIELVISDNCSSPSVQDVLGADILPKVRLIRNRFNVGANENILRGFEAARTPWLWTLSDDDRISATAVNDILRAISTFSVDPAVAILKFYDEHHLVPEFTMTTIDELPNCIGNLLFMSSSVYHVDNCREATTVAHQYSYSMAPALMIVLIAILKQKKAVFIEIVIAKWMKPPKDQEWSYLGFSNAILTMFEYPFPVKMRKSLYDKIRVIPYSLKRLAYIDLQHSCVNSPEARDTRFMIRCIYAKRAVLGGFIERMCIRFIRISTSISMLNVVYYQFFRIFVRDGHTVQYDRTSRA